jgi:hypothetical protein
MSRSFPLGRRTAGERRELSARRTGTDEIVDSDGRRVTGTWGGPAAASGCVNAGNETEAPLSLRLGRLQRRHAASTERLRQAMRLAFGDDDVGMVEEPVDGRRREVLSGRSSRSGPGEGSR